MVAFASCWFLPVGSDRFWAALQESLSLVRWYAREHVLLCLVPAFFIAGAISVFVSQGAVMKYLGPRAKKIGSPNLCVSQDHKRRRGAAIPIQSIRPPGRVLRMERADGSNGAKGGAHGQGRAGPLECRGSAGGARAVAGIEVGEVERVEPSWVATVARLLAASG